MATTPEELSSWVRSAWEADDCPPDTDLAAWTSYINRCLADRAEAQGLDAYGTDLGDKGEYLVDHCWCRRHAHMAEYSGLELAAEFEWTGTRGALEDDIVKLADVRASARLFIGTLRAIPWSTVDQIVSDVCRMLQAHGMDERGWIVVALAPKGRSGKGGALRIWNVSSAGAHEI